MITKLGLAALVGTLGTAAVGGTAMADERPVVQTVRYDGYGYGYGRGFDRDRFEHGRFERMREMRERNRWLRFHHEYRGYGYGRW
jgi:hypothetical protein